MVIQRCFQRTLIFQSFAHCIKYARRLRERVAKAKVYSPRLPSVFLSQLNKNEFASFQEKIRKFEFLFSERSLRDY
jgi:penicillin-binding protein 2